MKKMIKGLTPAFLICLVIGFLVAALGYLSFLKNVKEAGISDKQDAEDFMLSVITDAGSNLDAQGFLDLVQVVQEESVLLSDPEVKYCVYDYETDTLYDNDNAIGGEALSKLKSHELDKETIDGQYYFCMDYNDHIVLVVVYNTKGTRTLEQNVLKWYAAEFIQTYLVACLVMLLGALLSKDKTAGRKVICTTVFVWIFHLAVILCLISGQQIYDDVVDDKNRIYKEIEQDVELISAMTDEEAQKNVSFLCEAFGREDLPHSTAEECRRTYLDVGLSYYASYTDYYESIKLRDNILDTSVPIEKRVIFYPNKTLILNVIITYLLQAIMFGTFAVMLIFDVYNYFPRTPSMAEDEDRGGKRFFSQTEWLKLLNTEVQTARALVSAVSVLLLKKYVYSDYPGFASVIITIIIAAEGLLNSGLVYWVPKVFRLLKNGLVYLRIALGLMIAGTVLCTIFSSAIGYIPGYLLIGIGTAASTLMVDLYFFGVADKTGVGSSIKQINLGGTVGEISGYVLGSALVSLVDDRWVMLFSTAVLLLALGSSAFLSTEGMVWDVPDKVNLTPRLANKNALLYQILILIPYGFSDYFIKYRIPMDISSLGLASALVSFLYYARTMLGILFIYKRWGEKLLGKLPAYVRVAACVLILSLVFMAYAIAPGFGLMVLAVVVIAFLKSASGTTDAYAVSGFSMDDYEDMFAMTNMTSTAKSFSKTLAQILTAALGFVSLPVVMIGCSSVFLFLKREKTPTDGRWNG